MSGDEVGLVELFARVFKKPISTAHWLWKLRGYKLPFQNVWLAVDGDRIIAQYAGIPVRILTASGIRWAVLAVDAMVDADYRRKGVLTGIANRAHDSWQQAGAVLVYGLPNERLGPALDGVGMKYAFPVRWRRYPVRPVAILARRIGITFPTELLDAVWFASTRGRRRRGFELVEAVDADESFDRIFQQFTPSRTLTFVRDREWIRWRYFRRPEGRYRVLIGTQDRKPVGYVAYRVQNAGGLITEVLAPDDRTSLALIAGAVDQLRKNDAESISILAVPETLFDRLCGRRHFWAFKSFDFAVLPLASDFTREYVSDRNAWHLSGADFDVV